MHTVKGRAAGILQTPRPFQCKWHEGCSKSFNRKSDLQRHYRIHTNERPYACDYKPCEKTFIQRSALTVHRRTHTGDKPHKCPYTGCGKCFSDSSSLARHRRIHTNDKPYICKNPHCRKAFCRKTTMTKHFRKEHPSESLDGDDDADYSDIDESEEDVHGRSTELSREGSHAAFQQGTGFRDTPPAPRRASTYSADLWSLPGHSSQTPPTSSGQRSMKPRCDSPSEFMKMERAAQPPHRTCTDPFPNVQGGHFMPPATSLGGSVHVASSTSQPHPADGSMQSYIAPTTGPGMWPANAVMSDSPTSIDSVSSGFDHPRSAYNGQAYQGRPLNYSFGQHINQYQAHGQAAELQPVQDIILDEPSQPPHFNSLNHSTPEALQQYNGVAAQRIPEHGGQARSLHIQGQAPNAPNKSVNAAFTDGIPSTPVSAHSLPYSSAPELPYQEQQVQVSVPFNGYEPAVTFPPKNPFSYYSGWDKEAKDDAWGTMPSQVSFN